ncbi:MAG: autotransporter domain-containing protein [Candidatus Paracaedibacteraceae bacterium]|nr:autotransporter domain-containing protein [Candidatus Paracaedibacteraceae bacterium]
MSDTPSQTPNAGSAVNIIAGKTIFTGTKSYSPQTNVSGGELELQTDLPNSNITIGAFGTVTFNTAVDSTYSKVIFGNGTLTKNGTNTLTLSGDSSGFTGTTTVSGGELKLVNVGSNLGGDITVQSGATISGNGTTRNLTINNDGFVAPGNSIGTLHVAGDYIQNGTYNCEVNGVIGIPVAGTDNDLIDVTGNATLGGTLNVIPSGVFANGQSVVYTVLTSTGLGGSSFTSVTGTSPLFTYQANYTGTDAQLTLTKTYNISQIVTEGNLGSVASYMDNHAPATLEARLNTLTTEQLEQALSDLDPAEETQKTDFIASIESASMSTPFTWSGMDRMAKQSGQAMTALVHQVSSLKQSFVQLFGSKRQHRTIMQAISQASDPKQIPISARVNMGAINLWIQGGIGRFSQESTMDPSSVVIQGLDGNTYDTSVGLDHAISNTLKLGVTTGYTVSQYTMKADRAKGGVNSARFGLYGLWEAPSSWYVNGAVYYGHHRFKADRIMTFVPIVAHQRHNGHHVSGLAEVGKDIALGKSLVLTPYVGGGALFLRENGYTEYGAGIQNLSVKSRNSTTVQGKTGVQLANLWQWHDATPIYSFARLGITYRRAVGSHQKMSAGLVGQGGSFTVRTRNRNRVLANPNVGFTASLRQDLSATLAYDGELGSNQRNHQALVRVNWTF